MKKFNKTTFGLTILLFSLIALAVELAVEQGYSDVSTVNQTNVQRAVGVANGALPVGTIREVTFGQGDKESWKKAFGGGSYQWVPLPGTYVAPPCGPNTPGCTPGGPGVLTN